MAWDFREGGGGEKKSKRSAAAMWSVVEPQGLKVDARDPGVWKQDLKIGSVEVNRQEDWSGGSGRWR